MKSRKVNLLQVALTFAGSFLGAGFVSGQELFVYFVSYGKIGIPSVIIAISLMGILSYIIFSICMDTGIRTLDDLIIRKDIPFLKTGCAALLNFMTLVIDCVMTAGIAALFYRIFGLNTKVGTIIVLITAGIISYYGVAGMIKTFSMLVPFLIIFAIIISVVYISGADMSCAVFEKTEGSPLLGSWQLSAINYCSMNIIAVVGSYAAFSGKIKNKGTAAWGCVLGCVGMMLIAICIIFAMYLSPWATKAELPMLDISFELGVPAGFIYAVLLFFGMFGNSVACKVAILNYFDLKVPFIHKHRLLCIVIMSVLILFSSSMGFSDMVKIIEPLFGYAGYAVIALVCEHKFYCMRHKITV